MNHLVLLSICILSIEAFIRFNFLSILDSLLKITKKVIHILPKKNISDHWKEKVIPVYSLTIIRLSLQILLIFLFILSCFVFTNYLLNDFLAFTLSFFGIMEFIVFVFGYNYLRKLSIK